ncbi:hypothetical protein [Methylomonas sp. MgM2]
MNTSRIAGLGMSVTLLTSFCAFAEDYMPAEYRPAVEYTGQNTVVTSTPLNEPEASASAESGSVSAPETVEPQQLATSKNRPEPAETKAKSSVEPGTKPAETAIVSGESEESLLSGRNGLLVLLAALGIFMFFRKKPVQLAQAASEPPTSAITGVERYLEKVSPKKTGVAKYLERQQASAPSTGVAKYLAKQAAKN